MRGVEIKADDGSSTNNYRYYTFLWFGIYGIPGMEEHSALLALYGLGNTSIKGYVWFLRILATLTVKNHHVTCVGGILDCHYTRESKR